MLARRGPAASGSESRALCAADITAKHPQSTVPRLIGQRPFVRRFRPAAPGAVDRKSPLVTASLSRRRAPTGVSMDLTISKTGRHASASPQLLIVMVKRKAAPVDSTRFKPDLERLFAGGLLVLLHLGAGA